MDWMEEVQLRQKKKNRLLFREDSAWLQDLTGLIQHQDRKVLILWA